MAKPKTRTQQRHTSNKPEISAITRRSAPAATTGNGLVSVTEFHQGPIPAPSILRQYDDLHEGFAERIVAMAELEQSSRIALDQQVVKNKADDTKYGRRYAFATVVLFAIASIAGGIWISPTFGGLLGSGTLGLVVFAFITGRRIKS